MPETATQRPWSSDGFPDEARVGQPGTLTRIPGLEAGGYTQPRAPRDTLLQLLELISARRRLPENGLPSGRTLHASRCRHTWP